MIFSKDDYEDVLKTTKIAVTVLRILFVFLPDKDSEV